MSAVMQEPVELESAPDTAILTATLQLDDATRARLRRAALIVAEANAIVIDCPEMAEAANLELRDTKAKAKEIEKMRDDFVAPAKQILANCVKWFRPTADAYAEKERILKAKLVEWQGKEAKRIADERAKAEAEARRIQREAEQRAAAERARQEEAERKARAEAAQAEKAAAEARAKAEAARAAGDKAAAAEAERRAKAAAAEQAKKEEQERQAREEAARKAREAEAEAAARVAAAQAAARAAAQPAPALKGFGQADNWVVELATESEAQTIMLIVEQLDKRPDLIGFLKLDMVAAGRIGKALKANFNIPGLKCSNQPRAVSRKG